MTATDKKSLSNQPADYAPPRVWTWDAKSGGSFANINRPTAGATHERDLQIGRHPLQLYSQATPNGVKVTIMLEELLALGHAGAEYDAHLIRIGQGGSVFQWLCRDQSQFQEPGAAGPQYRSRNPDLRVGLYSALPGRNVRRPVAEDSAGAN